MFKQTHRPIIVLFDGTTWSVPYLFTSFNNMIVSSRSMLKHKILAIWPIERPPRLYLMQHIDKIHKQI